MTQTALDFTFDPSYRREDFLVSDANEEAFAWIEGWPEAWPSPVLNLYGPAGSGKTHLAHLWREQSGADWLEERRLAEANPAELLADNKAWIIEEPAILTYEKAWFHLLNTVREEGKWLLITSREPLARLKTGLPDLASRLSAVPSVRLRDPDDTLLEALLAKRFSDIQLRVAPEVMRFLVKHMERSFLAVEAIVRRLDRLALVEKKNITLPLARKILESQ